MSDNSIENLLQQLREARFRKIQYPELPVGDVINMVEDEIALQKGRPRRVPPPEPARPLPELWNRALYPNCHCDWCNETRAARFSSD
jgi:hypothetical protein